MLYYMLHTTLHYDKHVLSLVYFYYMYTCNMYIIIYYTLHIHYTILYYPVLYAVPYYIYREQPISISDLQTKAAKKSLLLLPMRSPLSGTQNTENRGKYSLLGTRNNVVGKTAVNIILQSTEKKEKKRQKKGDNTENYAGNDYTSGDFAL